MLAVIKGKFQFVIVLEPFIRINSGSIITTSIDIAENFKKDHSKVLLKIRELGKSENGFIPEQAEEFFKDNFNPKTYINDSNR